MTYGWVDFKKRMNDGLNDTNPNGSRSGDIVMVMNTMNGTVMVHEVDRYPGWHGSPTKAETEVPMIWHFGPGYMSLQQNLLHIVKGKIADVKGEDQLRSHHFKKILLDVLGTLTDKDHIFEVDYP